MSAGSQIAFPQYLPGAGANLPEVLQVSPSPLQGAAPSHLPSQQHYHFPLSEGPFFAEQPTPLGRLGRLGAPRLGRAATGPEQGSSSSRANVAKPAIAQ